ncbi:MAG: TRZ/ATZ family hydrolase [Rhodocyclaceae bacterium]|nr:TRZ/ATZ family hydrolase [Rhodocyclaceae bacterium]
MEILADELIEARWVLPMQPWRVIEHGAVALRDGRIVAVGPAAELAPRVAATCHARLPGHALLPGLVNAHAHAGMTLLRGYADDLPLMRWLQERVWPAEAKWVEPAFVRDGTRLACAEMLRGGTTTFSDMYFFPDAAIAAAQRAGLRMVAGLVVLEFPTAYARDAADYLHRGLALRDRWLGTPNLHFTLAPHAPYTVSDSTFAQVATYAAQLDLRIHIHIHETRDEVAQGVAQSGERPLARLKRLGLLGPELIGVHAVHLSDEEIALLAGHGASLVHCPVSNLKLGSGIARLADWLAAGITVGFGSDSVVSNNRHDLWAEMRTAALLAKGVSGDAAAVPAQQALHAATLGGATALGLGDETGSIEPGKAADLLAVDLAGADQQPLYDVASHLVYCAGREQVSDVWVAGEHRVSAGCLQSDDESELRALAADWQLRVAAT